jgi:hypothetical protein
LKFAYAYCHMCQVNGLASDLVPDPSIAVIVIPVVRVASRHLSISVNLN